MIKIFPPCRMIAIIFLLLINFLSVHATTTGKVTGVVIDKKTGEALVGVNVIIDGTSLGTATDINGRLFILNIPPGSYSVTAMMMGYKTVKVTNVRVQIDRTIEVDFELIPVVLDLGETMTVLANRELVRKDVSYSQTNMSSDILNAIPAAYKLDKSLVTQAGIQDEGFGLVIRRGRSQEISYYMDGLSLKNERTGMNLSRLSTTSIEEVQILVGGFNAEYGDARSGIVNVVTKNPRKKYSFNMNAMYSPLIGNTNGRKHFGPAVYSEDNWWEYGRFLWNDGQPAADRNKDGVADFVGWDAWATNKLFHGNQLTSRESYEVWAWQHRSVDRDGNVLIDGRPAQFTDENGNLAPVQQDAGHPLNYYAYSPDKNVDFTFSGPLIPWANNIPILSKTGFVLSHHYVYEMYPFFSAQQAAIDNTTQIKLLTDIRDDISLTINGVYSVKKTANSHGYMGEWESYGRDAGNSMLSMYNSYKLNFNIFSYDGIMTPRETYSADISAKLTHTLNSRTFYQVQYQYGGVENNKDPRNWRRNVEDDAITIGPVGLTEIPMRWNGGFDQADDRWDILGVYKMHHLGEVDYSWERHHRLTGDITSQITDHHQLKSGFELKHLTTFDFYGGIQYPEFYLEDDWEDPPGPGIEFLFNKPKDKIRQSYSSFYVQDKIEYEGMIMNVGVRFEAFKPNSDWYDRSDPFSGWSTPDPDGFAPVYGLDDTTTYYGNKADSHPKTHYTISPRFGISHQIGPESKIYFNYGHFYQRPSYRAMYAFEGGRNNWNQMAAWGNPWLKPPKTIQFESGYEQRLLSDYVILISGYYKDVTDDITWITYRQRTGGDYPYPYNGVSKDIKGFEVSIQKKYGQFITGFINSDYNIEKRSKLGWNTFHDPENNEYLMDPTYDRNLIIMDNPYDAAVQEPGSWRVKSNINLHTPRNFGPGPTFLGSKLLGAWSTDIFWEWRLGEPYTYNPDNVETLRYKFTDREKNYTQINLTISKKIKTHGIGMELFCSVTNLFNNKNPYTDPFEVGEDGGSVDYKRKDVHISSFDDVSHWKDYTVGYMEQLFDNGKKFGDVVDELYMPQRQYIMWYPPRDIWFGLKFSF